MRRIYFKVCSLSLFFSFFVWHTCKLAGAFPQILLVISAGRIATVAKCNDHIKHCIVSCCIVLYGYCCFCTHFLLHIFNGMGRKDNEPNKVNIVISLTYVFVMCEQIFKLIGEQSLCFVRGEREALTIDQ